MNTNNKGISSIISKAEKRAEWYKTTYPKANNFEKRYVKQFWSIINKWKRNHELTDIQEKLFESLVPERFK